ncbi:MAG: type II methionyl aminopeptidase [Methanomicrobiales archaeon]|nr:type II methionyl aminopeptidase [Methanomicrobiales archaeon]
MKDEILENYLQAGAIASRILALGTREVRVGSRILDVVGKIEDMVQDEGADLAFPLNLSVNEDAAHDTAVAGDTREFHAGDVVKLDLGVHCGGYIADTATSVDLGEHAALISASEKALEAAIGLAKPGIGAGVLGAAIEREIVGRGFRPVANLTGHGLDRYKIHTAPTIPNLAGAGGAILEEGMVVAIEPFASTGTGFVNERSRVEIYQQMTQKPVRLPAARRVLDAVRTRRGLPFARRWLTEEKLDIILPSLVRTGILHPYPVLHDVTGSFVSQHEHTIIITGDGCIVTTR